MVEHPSHDLLAMSLYRRKKWIPKWLFLNRLGVSFTLERPFYERLDLLNSNKAIALDKVYNVLLFIYKKTLLIKHSYVVCFVIEG